LSNIASNFMQLIGYYDLMKKAKGIKHLYA